MKRLFIFTIALSLGATLHAQTRDDYNAAVSKFQALYNSNQADSMFTMFSDRIQKLMPADKTKAMLVQLHNQLGSMISFEFTREEPPINYYKTTFKNGAVTFVFSLSKEHKFESFRFLPYADDGAPKEKSNFVYKSPAGDIYGTLSAPAAAGKKVPVVLLIAGSGPTDRNCNQPGMKTDAFKMMADSLLKDGIACVRYDKRGTGASMAIAKNEEDTRFDDMVDDVVGIIKMLKEDTRFSKIILLGHSEGSLIGMIAAAREKVGGYISLAGAGERADRLLEKQLSANSKEAAATARVIMDSIMNGYAVKNIDSDAYVLFRPSVQPYMRSWLKYDPQLEIKKLTIPVLILQGVNDFQASVNDAELLKKAAPKATLKLVPGMSHVLKQGPTDRDQNFATYNQPELPLSPGLMPPIYKFIKAIK